MSRFQAVTNPVLDRELDMLREEMGLRENQKGELLRELTDIAAWVVHQVRAGRVVEARGPDGVEVFDHPAVRVSAGAVPVRLDAGEVYRLAEILNDPGPPSPELRATLRRIADPERVPPELTWPVRTG